jgi:hypothetical protein
MKKRPMRRSPPKTPTTTPNPKAINAGFILWPPDKFDFLGYKITPNKSLTNR